MGVHCAYIYFYIANTVSFSMLRNLWCFFFFFLSLLAWFRFLIFLSNVIAPSPNVTVSHYLFNTQRYNQLAFFFWFYFPECMFGYWVLLEFTCEPRVYIYYIYMQFGDRKFASVFFFRSSSFCVYVSINYARCTGEYSRLRWQKVVEANSKMG